ncbi:Autoinducer 2 sensor kinase/phosphatase LuxQ [Massilia sp. Bi118]|uniref:ATP-binding protein n=1 Tax=Massilia sp. Bi118 TaxID=2822346 RepID=UPI001DAC9118|nr:ATP-binding protein [Massilia sp. Bi118]CAH0152080.1 Autoinducer 2 sensor kinase/phosphatase LuxQ [Massilia sp. Bi118]
MLIKTDDILSGDYGNHGHFVRFYDNDTLLLDEVAAYVDQALRADGRGIVIATAEHRDALALRLDALAQAQGRAAPAAQVLWLDAEATLAAFMVDGWPDRQRFDAVVGGAVLAAGADGKGVHAFGEMVALLCACGQYDAALELERMWNELAQRSAFSLFCAYPWSLFPSARLVNAFQRVCAEHDHACADAAMALPADDAELKLARLEQKVHALEAELARGKETEAVLRRNEREFSDFVENAAEGLHRVGADGTILWANKAELQMLGYRWEEYVGHNIGEFHVDEPVIGDILCRLSAGATLYDQPARLRCKDGSIKHVMIHSNAHFENGELRYTRCFTRDATERHERDVALAQRDSMLLNAPVAAALLSGPDFVFRLANRSYCELVGRSGLEGKAFLEVFPELRDSEPQHLLEQVYRSKVMARAEELRIVLNDADGQPRERFLKFSLEPLAVLDAEEPGVILVAVDVTEHVRSRQQIERAHAERAELLAELTAAGQAKDEFLAMLGHELRNPLSPIVTSLQLMRLRGEGAALREREIIERQVGHLVRLVDDLMDISKVTRGKIDLKFERVFIAQPLDKAIEMASLLLEKRRHRLDVEIEPGLQWEGDPVRLAQVVANLLTNAARYTEPGGHVRLRAGRVDAGEGEPWLRISVLDDGVGMAPELRGQVFDLFFQGKRNIDRAEGGLGIGLSLVKNIVELHGGQVEARSEGKDRGSEFVVLLPLLTPGAGAEESLPVQQAAPAAARRRIMLVDDNVDGAETLARLLGAHGHEVRVFHEPIAALAAVRAFRPDLAVLDIGLPVLDGYELARRMRTLLDGHPCRMVALTGYGQEADKARSEQAGFERHLVKPVNPDLVVKLVASASPHLPG